MTQEWHYTSNGSQQGPIDSRELKQLAHAGRLAPTDMVWHSGMPEWVAAENVKGLFPEPTTSEGQDQSTPPPLPPATQDVAPTHHANQSPHTTYSPQSVPGQSGIQKIGHWNIVWGIGGIGFGVLSVMLLLWLVLSSPRFPPGTFILILFLSMARIANGIFFIIAGKMIRKDWQPLRAMNTTAATIAMAIVLSQVLTTVLFFPITAFPGHLALLFVIFAVPSWIIRLIYPITLLVWLHGPRPDLHARCPDS